MSSESATQIFRRLFAALDSGEREATLDALRAGYELVNRDGVTAWLRVHGPPDRMDRGRGGPETPRLPGPRRGPAPAGAIRGGLGKLPHRARGLRRLGRQ